MARGVRVVSVERGHDPRRLTLVPFGGAGPMHGSPLARDLAIPRLLVPPTPGILCALGMLVADLRHDLVQTRLAAHAELSAAEAAAVFAPMLEEARRLLAEDRVPAGRQGIETRLDMRYVGQSFELPIAMAGSGEAEWAALVPAFHAEHARRFGHSDPAAPVEIVSFAVTATGLIDTPELPRPAKGRDEPPDEARRGTRRVFYEATEAIGGGNWIASPVWRREALLAGNRIAGPAIVEEVSATTVLYPGDQARVDEIGSLVVEIGS
jgi:N-methylhydantoinase A